VEARVDDARDVRHRQRRFREIGCQNDTRAMSGLQRRILIVGIKPAMEWQDRNASPGNPARQLIRGSSNLPCARQEAEDGSLRVPD
jgi:hypothetical protein